MANWHGAVAFVAGKGRSYLTAETQRAQKKAKGERQKLEGRRRSTETKANGEIETGPAVDGENREVTADCGAIDVGRNADAGTSSRPFAIGTRNWREVPAS